MILELVRPTRRRVLLAGSVAFAALNALAYVHARSFTSFAASGVRTPDPGRMGLGQKLHVLLAGPTLPRPTLGETPSASGLAFETHRFRTRDGLTLEAWRIPRPDARGMVVLFHGYADSKSSLLREARAFGDLGYETVLVDFRGSGGSDGDHTTIGYTEAEDVWTSVVNVGRWPAARHLVLFGSSMGAVAVLRAASLHELPVEGLILQSPFGSLLETVGHRCDRMHVPAFPVAHLLVFWGGVQGGFDGFAHNPVRYAGRVQVPVLILHGERDPLACVGEARAIYDHLGGRKELVVFPRASHVGLLTADRVRWRDAVTRFLG
jgi:alpha-beta hydrolase superfamily lysophospholipase